MNTALHGVSDANGRPFSFCTTVRPGLVNDYTGAAALLDDLPEAQGLLDDRGYDADWFRDQSGQYRFPAIPCQAALLRFLREGRVLPPESAQNR